MKYTTYRVRWSDEDREFVATCDEFPSLSWLASSRGEALKGLDNLVAGELMDMKRRRHLASVWEQGYKAVVQGHETGRPPENPYL